MWANVRLEKCVGYSLLWEGVARVLSDVTLGMSIATREAVELCTLNFRPGHNMEEIEGHPSCEE